MFVERRPRGSRKDTADVTNDKRYGTFVARIRCKLT